MFRNSLFLFAVFFIFLSAPLRAEREQEMRSAWWSSFVDRPRVLPRLIETGEIGMLQPGCPTGFPGCAELVSRNKGVWTNALKTEVVKPILAKDLKHSLLPGDIIVFNNQGILREGGLSLALNGNHHTALVGINPDGRMSFTASPKPKNGANFDEDGDGFHILRMKNWPPGMSDLDKQKAIAYVQKYYDILYRSDEKSGVVFDFQGDMDVTNPATLKAFAQNLKDAKPGALMKDVFPGGQFCVFCSESAVTAWALAFELVGQKFKFPRAEGMHAGINLIHRDFLAAKKACTGKCDDVDVMKKVMKDFFSGEALRVERVSDDPTQSSDYSDAERTTMAKQMLMMMKFGPRAAHLGIWMLKTTRLDRVLGEYIRRAMYATSPADLVWDPLKASGYFSYEGTYIGPKAHIEKDQLVTNGLPRKPGIAAVHGHARRQVHGIRQLNAALGCRFADLPPPPGGGG